MKVNVVSLNETRYFNISTEDKPYIKDIRSVYAYDPESGTYLCEITPSYELRYLYTYIVGTDEMTRDISDILDERYCNEGNEDVYMHCSSVRSLKNPPPKECGEFDDIDEACEYLRANWPT